MNNRGKKFYCDKFRVSWDISGRRWCHKAYHCAGADKKGSDFQRKFRRHWLWIWNSDFCLFLDFFFPIAKLRRFYGDGFGGLLYEVLLNMLSRRFRVKNQISWIHRKKTPLSCPKTFENCARPEEKKIVFKLSSSCTSHEIAPSQTS